MPKVNKTRNLVLLLLAGLLATPVSINGAFMSGVLDGFHPWRAVWFIFGFIAVLALPVVIAYGTCVPNTRAVWVWMFFLVAANALMEYGACADVRMWGHQCPNESLLGQATAALLQPSSWLAVGIGAVCQIESALSTRATRKTKLVVAPKGI